MRSDRFRLLQRLAGTAAFGLVVFVVSFALSFPFDRLSEHIVAVAATRDLDLEVGSAGPKLGLGVALRDVRIASRPEPGKKPSMVLKVPTMTIGVSPLAELRGEVSYDIAMEAMGGEVEADIRATKTAGSLKVNVAKVQMAELPGIKDTLNLPLGGLLDLRIDLNMPQNRNSEAVGTVTWKCALCVVGDGKEKVKLGDNPMLAQGITIPKIRLGDFAGMINFEKGVGKLQGVAAKGLDGEIQIDGEVRLSEMAALSFVDLYLRFKLSDALLKSSDKLQAILGFAEEAKRVDGFYGFHVSGPLSRPRFDAMKTSPFATSAPGTPSGRISPSRPSGFGSGMPRPSSLPSAPPPPPPPPPPPAPPSEDEPKAVDPQKDPNANLPRFPTSPPRDE